MDLQPPLTTVVIKCDHMTDSSLPPSIPSVIIWYTTISPSGDRRILEQPLIHGTLGTLFILFSDVNPREMSLKAGAAKYATAIYVFRYSSF